MRVSRLAGFVAGSPESGVGFVPAAPASGVYRTSLPTRKERAKAGETPKEIERAVG